MLGFGLKIPGKGEREHEFFSTDSDGSLLTERSCGNT